MLPVQNKRTLMYRFTHSSWVSLKLKVCLICFPALLKINTLVLLVLTVKHQSLQYCCHQHTSDSSLVYHLVILHHRKTVNITVGH
jgi:hypothetical protein